MMSRLPHKFDPASIEAQKPKNDEDQEEIRHAHAGGMNLHKMKTTCSGIHLSCTLDDLVAVLLRLIVTHDEDDVENQRRKENKNVFHKNK